jgi:hypothetical protein
MLAKRGGCTGTPCAQGCYVGGFALDCGMVTALLESGAAVPCPDNNCGPRNITGEDESGNPTHVWAIFNGSGYWLSDGGVVGELIL